MWYGRPMFSVRQRPSSWRPSLCLLGFLCLWTAGVQAQTSLLPSGRLLGMGLQTPDASTASRSVITVAGQPFTQGLRVVSAKVATNAWNIQLGTLTTAPVASGDVIAGEIYLRRVSPTNAPALAELVFEQAGSPYTQSLVRVLSEESGTWTRYRFAFPSKAAYATGAAQFNIRLGYTVQTLELGGLPLTNHGQARPLAEFPDDLTYAGREPDAPWRAAANASIEKIRKANLTLDLRDTDGFPLPGVPVELRLVRHEFAFGSAVAGSRLLASGADADRYRGVITQWFNTAVLENDLKWPQYEGNPSLAQRAVTWLRTRDIDVRGHNLIWPGTNQPAFLPTDVRGMLNDVPRLRTRINTHFTNILSRFAGQIADWDVVNEPLHERALEGVMGRGEVVEWFRIARKLEPSATLYLNEYVNLEDATRAGSLKLRQYADDLRASGAPVDALGLQAHFGGFLTSPPELLARLDLISGLDAGTGTYPLRITEFDMNVADEQVQGDYTRDFLTAAFSHPAVNGVLMWGFWANQHWIPQGALFRPDWSLKPNAIAWSNLTFRVGTTHPNVKASSTGKATARGFKGDYEVTVRLPGTNVVTQVSLASDGTVRATLPVVRPQIQVTPGDLFTFSWPGFASGYRLEYADRIDAEQWLPIEGFAQLGADGWKVQLPAPDETQFYRLRRGGE